jgi:hypothetical protein
MRRRQGMMRSRMSAAEERSVDSNAQGTRPGAGPGRGRGGGRCRAGADGIGHRLGRSGMLGSAADAAVEDACVCTGCGKVVAHRRGVRCSDTTCPDCGRAMRRQG